MSSTSTKNIQHQKAKQIADLKRLTAGIIRSQGNRFVKELLRSKNIRIGVNKDDFVDNLNKAIEGGQLVLSDVSEWLKEVEGWGNQHVYIYKILPELFKNLTESKIYSRVRKANLNDVWNGETMLEFPDQPKLTSISFKNSVLRIIWQESSPGWTPVPDKNFIREEGLDTFEYRAHRKIEQRAITRFEAHLDKKLAGLFISKPIQGNEHQAAVSEAKRVISLLMDNSILERGQIKISVVSRNLDQKNVPTNAEKIPDIKTQKSRLTSGGSYIEFAANSNDKAYWEEPAIMDVRKSVRAQQLIAFQGTGGVFIFNGEDFARNLRVQLYGKENRVRLWAQMDAAEVWQIINTLSEYQ
jgi:hypothetical protein